MKSLPHDKKAEAQVEVHANEYEVHAPSAQDAPPPWAGAFIAEMCGQLPLHILGATSLSVIVASLRV